MNPSSVRSVTVIFKNTKQQNKETKTTVMISKRTSVELVNFRETGRQGLRTAEVWKGRGVPPGLCSSGDMGPVGILGEMTGSMPLQTVPGAGTTAITWKSASSSGSHVSRQTATVLRRRQGPGAMPSLALPEAEEHNRPHGSWALP